MAKKDKRTCRPPTIRFKKTFKFISANVGVLRDAMRAAGYSKSYIESGHFMKTKTYIETLNEIGLTDSVVGEGVRKLATASRHEQKSFPDQYHQVGKGKKIRTIYTPVSDDEISKIVTSIPDARLVSILRNKWNHEKVAYFTIPDQVARKGGLELVHKSKSLFSPLEVRDVTPPGPTPEEVAAVDKALKGSMCFKHND